MEKEVNGGNVNWSVVHESVVHGDEGAGVGVEKRCEAINAYVERSKVGHAVT